MLLFKICDMGQTITNNAIRPNIPLMYLFIVPSGIITSTKTPKKTIPIILKIYATTLTPYSTFDVHIISPTLTKYANENAKITLDNILKLFAV